MAVGFPVKDDYATGDVLTAANMNDLSGTLNTVPSTIGAFAAAKNKIINGDFNVNQRAFTSTTTDGAYTFDRWRNGSDALTTVSAQTFTAGAAPVSAYESTNFIRLVSAGQSAAGAASIIAQRVEDVRTLTGTVTISFWAKAGSGTPKLSLEIDQQYGSGGSTRVTNDAGQVTLSTSWVRYSKTVTVSSFSGKTVGAASYAILNIFCSAGSNFNARTGSLGIQSNTFDIWGVQVEAGSIATPFQTATGTIQGELAACQRYYQRIGGNSAYEGVVVGIGASSTLARFLVPLKVTMRVAPTSIETNALAVWDTATVVTATGATLSSAENGPNFLSVFTSHASGITQFRPYFLLMNNSTSAYLGINAEL
jgi:hypothetical protein